MALELIDIKISKTQISKIVKHGGNLFTTLASLRTRLLPYATSVISKAVSALGSLGIDIKLFGKGRSIPNPNFQIYTNVTTIQKNSLQKHRLIKLTKLIRAVEDWLSNRQENR